MRGGWGGWPSICTYVCIYKYIHHMCVYIYIFTIQIIYTYTHIFVCVYMHIYIYLHLSTCNPPWQTTCFNTPLPLAIQSLCTRSGSPTQAKMKTAEEAKEHCSLFEPLAAGRRPWISHCCTICASLDESHWTVKPPTWSCIKQVVTLYTPKVPQAQLTEWTSEFHEYGEWLRSPSAIVVQT